MKQTIIVHNLGELPTAPLDDFNELQEDFKLPDSGKNWPNYRCLSSRVVSSTLSKRGKIRTEKLWIIDAHQRKKSVDGSSESRF